MTSANQINRPTSPNHFALQPIALSFLTSIIREFRIRRLANSRICETKQKQQPTFSYRSKALSLKHGECGAIPFQAIEKWQCLSENAWFS